MTQLPFIPTQGEIKGLMAQAPIHTLLGVRNRAIMEAMYRAGLRVSEVESLTDRDVCLERDMLMLRHTKRDKSRNVPFDNRLRAWLIAWMAARDSAGVKSELGYFFCTREGGRLHTGYCWQFITRYANNAGLPTGDKTGRNGVSPHTLRHTYATELLSEGFNIVEIAALLGHSSIKTTERYTHIMPAQLASKIKLRAVETVEEPQITVEGGILKFA